jgi:hypothetical protein
MKNIFFLNKSFIKQHLKLIIIISLFWGFNSCQKDIIEKQEISAFSDKELNALTSSFEYSTNLYSKDLSTGIITKPKVVEQRLLFNMSEKYDNNINYEYKKQEPVWNLKITNKSLPNIKVSFNEKNENELRAFIGNIFFQSEKLYLTSKLSPVMNKKVVELNDSLKKVMSNFFVENIKKNKSSIEINVNKLNNKIYSTLSMFETGIKYNIELTESQKTQLLNGILLSKVNLINTIEFAKKYPLKVKKGWFKNLIKEIVKVVVTVVVTITTTVTGVAAGMLTTNPSLAVLGGMVGFVAGIKLSKEINNWIETW